jgi:hypothetical protein
LSYRDESNDNNFMSLALIDSEIVLEVLFKLY